jgi:competence protein ComEA
MAEEERTEEEKRGGFIWLISGVLVGAIVAVGGMTLAQRTQPAAIEILPPVPSPTPAPSATPRPLRVYITGAVNNPDVYELPAGSIVADAVRAAGDFDDEAARELINLALPLSDGMQVHVPALVDDASQPVQQPATPPVISSAPQPAGTMVNINTADANELDTLPGVGPATAKNIVDYRQANGPFARIEQIMDVSGIGPAKFEQMKEMITVE